MFLRILPEKVRKMANANPQGAGYAKLKRQCLRGACANTTLHQLQTQPGNTPAKTTLLIESSDLKAAEMRVSSQAYVSGRTSYDWTVRGRKFRVVVNPISLRNSSLGPRHHHTIDDQSRQEDYLSRSNPAMRFCLDRRPV
jgi:hypothetical protein